MTDNAENLILEHLRAMRASLARLEENDTFLNARISSLEPQMAGVHSEMAGVHADMATMNSRMDRMENATVVWPGNIDIAPETSSRSS